MKKLVTFLLSVVLIVIVAALLAFPTMWAWNAFMPKVFGLVSIGFVDALWLNLLASCLFKSVSSN